MGCLHRKISAEVPAAAVVHVVDVNPALAYDQTIQLQLWWMCAAKGMLVQRKPLFCRPAAGFRPLLGSPDTAPACLVRVRSQSSNV